MKPRSGPIRIGIPTILSGRVAQLGISSRNAIMMEVDKFNAAGGLGGYFPPLVMGATYNATDKNYTVGLLLLVATCLVAAIVTAWRLHVRPAAEITGGAS